MTAMLPRIICNHAGGQTVLRNTFHRQRESA